MAKIREIKRNLDGQRLEFECQLLSRDADGIILHYVSPRAYDFQTVRFVEGCRTTALYQPGKPYVLWRMESPSGELLGYYIHLAANVSLGAEQVEWDDLTVDVWVHPDGRYEIWDEDELRRLREQGIISEDQWLAIEGLKGRVVENLTEIVASAEAKLTTVRTGSFNSPARS